MQVARALALVGHKVNRKSAKATKCLTTGLTICTAVADEA